MLNPLRTLPRSTDALKTLGLYVGANGIRWTSRYLGDLPWANSALARVAGIPQMADLPTEPLFKAMASIAEYRLFDRRPLCRDVDDLLSHRDWFSYDAPVEGANTEDVTETPVVIIDDFYEDPHAIRELALKSPYFQFYPTWFCTSQNWRHERNFMHNPPEVRRKIEQACGVEIAEGPELWSTRPWNGAFHYKVREPFTVSAPLHTHQTLEVRYGYNGIVYLNPPGTYPPRTGVSVWRSRQTGKCVAAHKVYKLGIHDFDLALHIENKFNRMVLLRSDVWHMGESGFGDRIDGARLFQTFFVEIKGKYEKVVRQSSASLVP